MTRTDVVAEAREWIGTRWMHGQSSKGLATDCYGLIVGIGVSLGVKEMAQCAADPIMKGYGRQPDASLFAKACQKYLDEVPVAIAGLGDILVFRWDVQPQHLGIVSSLDPLQIIHAFASARKVCEIGIDGRWRQDITWRSLIVGAWRFRGMVE